MYEVFEHTADLGLSITAGSEEELFRDAGLGLMSLLVANPSSVRAVQELAVHVTGDDAELLLFDWLSELLYVYETQRTVFCDFQVTRQPTGLTAIAHGEPLDPARHGFRHEVKAITYHGLKVRRTGSGWQAELIVDI